MLSVEARDFLAWLGAPAGVRLGGIVVEGEGRGRRGRELFRDLNIKKVRLSG